MRSLGRMRDSIAGTAAFPAYMAGVHATQANEWIRQARQHKDAGNALGARLAASWARGEHRAMMASIKEMRNRQALDALR